MQLSPSSKQRVPSGGRPAPSRSAQQTSSSARPQPESSRCFVPPFISNVLVTRTLIDGGAGLNVLSVETFNNLQVPYNQLQPTKPFSGVIDGSTDPIGKVRLPVTFGARDNYRTELIDFDVAHIPCRTTPSLGTQRWPSSWL